MGQQKREKINRLEHKPAVHRTKGLRKSREELTGCGPAPLEAGGRGEGKGAGLAPRTASATALQTGLQFLTKDLLRFWMVNNRREGCSKTQGAGTRPVRAGTGAGEAEGRRCTHPIGRGGN